MKRAAFCLLIFLFSTLTWGRNPCDGLYNPELGLTEKERDLLGLVDMLSVKQVNSDLIETEIRNYLIKKQIPFSEKKVTLQETDFGVSPVDNQATVFEVELAQKFSKKLYYSPQMEVFRLHNPDQILKFEDGVVLSIKDLYYFERPQVVGRIERSLNRPLENYGGIPNPENKVDFVQYLKEVETHLINQGIQYTKNGKGLDVSFSFVPEKGSSKLNKLAQAIDEKFAEARLVYHPLAIKNENASGMFSPSKNTVYISHESIVSGRVDYVVVHELMHANFFNRFLMEGRFSPFHGEVRPLAGLKLSNMTAYENYMSLEEVATHSLNVHMAGKRLWLNWEMPRVSRKYVETLVAKTNLAKAIADKAVSVMDQALKQIENNTIYLRGHESGNGFTMIVTNDEFQSVLPLFFRNESDEIRAVAQKYPSSNDAVEASDVKKIKKYLKEIIQERKSFYEKISSNHHELLQFMAAKTNNAGRFGYRFDEVEMKQILNLAGKGRASSLEVNFEEAPEVKSVFKTFREWLY